MSRDRGHEKSALLPKAACDLGVSHGACSTRAVISSPRVLAVGWYRRADDLPSNKHDSCMTRQQSWPDDMAHFGYCYATATAACEPIVWLVLINAADLERPLVRSFWNHAPSARPPPQVFSR